MGVSAISTCLGCGKQISSRKPNHRFAYAVCSECADIMRQGLHSEHVRVMRNLSRNLDSARQLTHVG